jgi:hypothetical protein
MARNPIEEAYLRGLGVRQSNMPMTEVDSLFNPYTYNNMNNATRVASLPNTANDAGTMTEINENYADAPLSANPYGFDPLLFVDSPINQQSVNQQPTVKIDPSPTQQTGNFDQFQRNIKENVFNPRTNEFEPTTYLLDRIAPNYSQRITNFMTGATPDMSQGQLDAIQANVRNVQADTLSNPVRAVMNMQSSLPDPMSGQRSGAEQEEFNRRQEDAQRRADQFDQFMSRERTRDLENTLGLERGARGGQPTAFEPGGIFSFFTGN